MVSNIPGLSVDVGGVVIVIVGFGGDKNDNDSVDNDTYCENDVWVFSFSYTCIKLFITVAFLKQKILVLPEFYQMEMILALNIFF